MIAANIARLNLARPNSRVGRRHSAATREKMRAAKLANPTKYWLGKKRQPHSDETKQRMRDAKMRSGFVPSNEARRLGAKVMRGGPTSIERRVAGYLRSIGVSFFPQFEIGRYVCDFVVPLWNLAIECDGSFWHNGKFANKSKEQRRDAFITQQGIRVVRLPEDLIKDDERLSSAIKTFVCEGEAYVSTSI